MSVEIVVRFLEENLYAEHFINYYLQLGFDHIHILFEKNQEPLRIENEKVSVIVHDYLGNDVFCHLKTLLSTTAEWIFFCDADEYLYLKEYPTIQRFLETVPTDIEQIFFQWAMIENYSYMTEKQDLFDCLSTHKMYANPYIKSMVRYSCVGEKNITPHYCENIVKNYIWNKSFTTSAVSIMSDDSVDNYSNTTYPFIIHFHTRSIQNIFIKGLKTNFVHSGKHMDVSKLNECIAEKDVLTIRRFTKLALPLHHSKGSIIHLPVSLKGPLIHFDLENDQLYKICKSKEIDFKELIKIIKALDILYTDYFRQ